MRLTLTFACSLLALAAPAAAMSKAPPAPLDVAIVWHQHQPQYPKRPGTKVYEQPWVRLHAAKDYHDMAAIAREFPGLKLTINLTPVLLAQLDDYLAGATDRHAELALKDPATLTKGERAEARDRFTQVSGPMLARFPRLAQLKARPSWNAAEVRDAAALFHLAWTDPGFLARPPLAALVRKGRNYAARDVRTVLAEHRRIMADVVPLHKRLQDEGRLEVTTTPYFHPILPLIHDSDLAREALPQAPMPAARFRRPADAAFHVRAAVADYTRRFGRPPRGMWPGEGSVAQAVAPLFAQHGIRWIATDEDVLARSLGTKLRDGEDLSGPGRAALYRAYQTTDGPAIVFRDRKLSDDIGFRYAKMAGEAAAADLLGQLRAVAMGPRTGDALVTIVLDGENAWENYPDDGKAFLRALYRGLTRDRDAFRTTTPSEHLAAHRPAPLARLWSGSWIGASYATWIGEDEENRAWDLLARAREAVAAHARRHGEASAANRAAMAKIHAAEGSDWFWWYGQDQDSGRDHEFDAAYRGLLADVYRAIGQPPPADLAVPIVQLGATPTRTPSAYLAPTIDGPMGRTEWAKAGSVFAEGGAMATGGRPFDALFYGWDKQHLYLAVQHGGEAGPFAVLLGKPGGGGHPMPPAPFLVHAAAEVDARGQAGLGFPGKPGPVVPLKAAHGRGTTELMIRWADLGVRSGDPLDLVLRTPAGIFPARPLRIKAPILPIAPLARLVDGPDAPAWSLPTGGAYTRPAVDLQALEVGEEDGAWAFTWKVGAVRDPWGSPIGLSLATLDCYLAPGIFVEGRLPPPTPLLDGRDARADRPWTRVVSVEGWQQGVYGPDGTKLAEVQAAVDPLAGEVRARVPKGALPGDPRQWAYLATLAGQDGFAPGRIRKVLPKADAERFGGRMPGRGSNLLDVLVPGGRADAHALLNQASENVVLPLVRPAE